MKFQFAPCKTMQSFDVSKLKSRPIRKMKFAQSLKFVKIRELLFFLIRKMRILVL